MQGLTTTILKKYFKYDQIFNLLEYDTDMDQLYNDIALLKKDSYEPNYRFIFQHWDTDYYITNTQPGLTLRNLQRILVTLDISNCFCLILTQQNLDNELEQLRVEETVDDRAIATIQTLLQNQLWINHQDVNLNHQNISFKYQLFSRVRRNHRALLIALLKEQDLLNDGMISFSSDFK